MLRFARIAIVILTALALLIGGAGAGLAAVHPLRPGTVLFPLQHFAEQTRARMIPDQPAQASFYLELAAHRAADLAEATGTQRELPAIDYLDSALDQAAQSIAEVPEPDAQKLAARLGELAKTIEAILADLQFAPLHAQAAYERILVKVQAIYLLVADLSAGSQALALRPEEESAQVVGSSGEGGDPSFEAIDPHQVIFPPGSPGAEHTFFPLEGGHSALECLDCHTTGQFQGLSQACLACHALDEPLNHYPGECTACHSLSSWFAVDFDHTAVGGTACQTCHSGDKPANHYGGPCSACHNTSNWRQATFNHQAAGATDCRACHSGDKPANHYAGQCSACHNTSNWRQATFNHQAVGATDCRACHSGDKPANHYAGQCSACHNTSKWSQASFNHQAVGATDCQACHSGDKPANHYAGQCSACHNTSKWSQASFNHQAVGATDCQACHSGDKPANHYSGQCSACHNTSNWGQATFNHQAAGATDCQGCHSGDKPANHFPGQCSDCHNTSSWDDANFSHTFPINHKDADGQCASCHPSGYNTYTCFGCHDQDEMADKHKEMNDYSNNCMQCHPDGKKPKDD